MSTITSESTTVTVPDPILSGTWTPSDQDERAEWIVARLAQFRAAAGAERVKKRAAPTGRRGQRASISAAERELMREAKQLMLEALNG